MGATLRYAKVVDADQYQQQGGVTKPRTESVIRIPEEGPSRALPFLVVRAWDYIDSGGIGETWRIQGPEGGIVHEMAPRTVLADQGEIVDELDDVEFPYASDDYTLVLTIEDREVARVDFPVIVDESGGRLAE